MGGDAVLEGVVEDLGNVLVAVMSVKEIEVPILGTHDKRSCGDGLGGIPHELGADGVAVVGVQSLDAEEIVVDEAEVRDDLTGTCLSIVHTAAHTVEGHRDHDVAGLPTDGTVFGIVNDGPSAGLGLDEALISIVVVLWREVIDGGVLVEVVGRVGFAFGGGTIADIVVIVGDLACRN